MMAKVLVYNPNPGPVIVDDSRTIGGSEWTKVDRTDLVKSMIEEGVLLETPKASSAVSSEPTEESQDGQDQQGEDNVTKPSASRSRRRKSPVKE